MVAVEPRRRALQTECQAAKAVDLYASLRGVRGSQTCRNSIPRVANWPRKDRPSVGLDCARPRFSLLALLADVEAATGLANSDFVELTPHQAANSLHLLPT